MAYQDQQIPINPNNPNSVPPPPPIPYHQTHPFPIINPNYNSYPIYLPPEQQQQQQQIAYSTPSLCLTGKRSRDEAEGATDVPSPKRPAKSEQDVLYRIVVPSKQIGKVIGAGGSRIQKIREDTKATIKIADALSRHEERCIIISSKDIENVKSDAENALQQIASLILKEDDSNIEALKMGAAGHVASNTIRLLIAGSQAGCLIGTSGHIIENLRDSSGATIAVLAPNQLPVCASAYESDRVVQISGDEPAVLKALEEIGCLLRQNPAREVISITPTYNFNAFRIPQPYMDPTAGKPILQLIM